MPKITFITQDDKSITVDGQVGMSLLVTAQDHDLEGLEGMCNGCCSCGTCCVEIPELGGTLLTPMYSGEKQVLSALVHTTQNSRRACQIIIDSKHDGLIVKINKIRHNTLYITGS